MGPHQGFIYMLLTFKLFVLVDLFYFDLMKGNKNVKNHDIDATFVNFFGSTLTIKNTNEENVCL
jgi:hypothetical protein